jgi:hypothetical protein
MSKHHTLFVTFYEGTAPVSLAGKIPEAIVSILPSKGEKTMETAMIQTPEFETTQTIDPREAKLKDIIEKGKASLHKTLEEIQHEFVIREDMARLPENRRVERLRTYRNSSHKPSGIPVLSVSDRECVHPISGFLC